jgi:hypothetical protein
MKQKNLPEFETTPAHHGSSPQNPGRLSRLIGLGLCYGYLLGHPGCISPGHFPHPPHLGSVCVPELKMEKSPQMYVFTDGINL